MKNYCTFLLCGLILIGCAGTSEKTISNSVLWHTTPPVAPPQGIYAAIPIVGLFMGVSNYEDGTIPFTPAHTLSAAQMHETFFEALRTYHQIEFMGSEGMRFIVDIEAIPIKSAFSKSGRYLATLDKNGVLRITSGTIKFFIGSIEEPIVHFMFGGSYMDEWIVAVSDKGNLFASSLKYPKIVKIGKQEHQVTSLAIDDINGFVATGEKDGSINIWKPFGDAKKEFMQWHLPF